MTPFLGAFLGAFLILWGVGLYIQSLTLDGAGWYRALLGLGAISVVAGGLVVGT